MTWLRSEIEVDEMIKDMVNRTKGNYLTQGVAFNKNCPRQMALLKKSLMASVSFSGLAKEILAVKFNGGLVKQDVEVEEVKPAIKNVGNFL